MQFFQKSDYIESLFTEYKRKNVALKIATIISYTFIILALIILIKIPIATGYEISIYNAYPTLFWFLLLGSIIISTCIIILSSIANSKYWVFGVLSLFICYSIILLLPSIRGYFFMGKGSNDMFTHLAYIRTILESGHSQNLIYPMTHILSTELNLIAFLPLKSITNLFAVFFTLLYITSFFILGKVILKNNRGGIFMFVFASPLMFSFLHYSFFPFFFALPLIPFILYCFHKKIIVNSWEFSLMVLILSFNTVFFHPLVLIILLITFIIFGIFFKFDKKSQYKFMGSKVSNNIGILIISFFLWYFAFKSFLGYIDNIIKSLFFSGETTIFEYQKNTIESSNADLLLILERFLKIYGSISLYFLLAIFCLIIVFKKKNITKYPEKIYSLIFICAIFFGIFQTISYLIIFEPIRVSSFAIIIATVLIGIVSYRIFETTKTVVKKKLIVFCMIVIICSSSVLGVLNLYDSPWKGTPNNQMTQMDANGLNWLLKYANYSIPVMNELNPIKKYGIYMSTYSNNSDYEVLTEINMIPTHFGYDRNETLYKTIGYHNRYMLTSEFVREAYLSIPEDRQLLIPRYLENDFLKLNNDSTVNKIYLNGEFEIWSVLSRL